MTKVITHLHPWNLGRTVLFFCSKKPLQKQHPHKPHSFTLLKTESGRNLSLTLTTKFQTEPIPAERKPSRRRGSAVKVPNHPLALALHPRAEFFVCVLTGWCKWPTPFQDLSQQRCPVLWSQRGGNVRCNSGDNLPHKLASCVGILVWRR